MEIERKFLLASLPQHMNLGKGDLIAQGYISIGEPEVRVRSKAGRFYLTIKKGSGLVRDEFETRISPSVFKRLWTLTAGKRIRKTRFTICDDGLRWEIDEYHGYLKGLYTAEVELKKPSQLVCPPDFLPVVSDVTHNRRYKNKGLLKLSAREVADLMA